MRLFIIGNGFDLHHGINSSYGAFRNFLIENYYDIFRTFELFNLLGEELWSDFEANLVNLDEEMLFQYYVDSLVSYESDDWSDKYHHEFQYFIEEEVWRMTFGLKNAFLKWILSLNVNNGVLFDGIRSLFYQVEDSVFLNFNYTSTLEYKYNIPSSRILYIHGKAIDCKSELVLGHSAVGKIADRNLWCGDVRAAEAELYIKDYYTNTAKSYPKIIADNLMFFRNLADIEQIYVLGHSMSLVDRFYFQEIVKYIKVSKVEWNVSYYTGFDKMRHYNLLKILDINDIKIRQFKLDTI